MAQGEGGKIDQAWHGPSEEEGDNPTLGFSESVHLENRGAQTIRLILGRRDGGKGSVDWEKFGDGLRLILDAIGDKGNKSQQDRKEQSKEDKEKRKDTRAPEGDEEDSEAEGERAETRKKKKKRPGPKGRFKVWGSGKREKGKKGKEK